jgi:hypothetical protein
MKPAYNTSINFNPSESEDPYNITAQGSVKFKVKNGDKISK